MTKLGIFDWGVGGVGVMNRILEKVNADVIYFSDTGFTPYGKVSEEELRQRVSKVIDYLRFQECDIVVAACNAASTVIPDEENIYGMVKPAIEMVEKMNLDSIGIVGGKRTIESEIYKNAFQKAGMKVKQQIAQPLSGRIESGDLSSPELMNDIRNIFSPLANEKHILLACTHYPLITDRINEIYPDCSLIDPAMAVAEMASGLFQPKNNPYITWMTSGNIYDMHHSLCDLYGIKANRIERNNL